jgi:hypothetical protein
MIKRPKSETAPLPLPEAAERAGGAKIFKAGPGMRAADFGKGPIYSKLPRGEFAHPWSVMNMAWREWEVKNEVGGAKEVKSGWTLQVLPGFVNGEDPLAYGVFATGGLSRDASRGAGSALNRVGGAAREYGRVRGSALVTFNDKPDWYPLMQGPVIPVTGYEVMVGGQDRALPPFFKKNFNVEAAASSFREAGIVVSGEKVSLDFTPGSPLAGGSGATGRKVVAQDFWVQVARAALKPTVTITGNLLTGQLVEYNIGFDTAELNRVGNRARIYQGDFEQLERERRAAAAAFSTRVSTGGPVDDGVDRQLLFTVWLLGPEKKPQIYSGAVDAKELDENGKKRADKVGPDWTPFIQYGSGVYGGGWWNLNHAAKNVAPLDFGRFFSGMDLATAALVGRYTIVPQATMGAMNAEANRIFNGAYSGATNEGRFWT